MRRREFISVSIGLVGVASPIVSTASPCPPSLVNPREGLSAVTTCGTNSSSAPAWFQSLPEKTWTVIAGGNGYGATFQNGSTLSAQWPGLSGVSCSTAASSGYQSGIIRAWCGGVVNQELRELILAANGGHGDYWGNEVYALQLNQAIPAWIRLTDPTPASFCNGKDEYLGATGGAPAHYADGRPRAMHTANTQCYGAGKVWQMGQSAFASIGHSNSHTWAFDRDSLIGQSYPVAHDGGIGAWRYIGSGPVAPATVGFGAAAWDPVGRKAWGVYGEDDEKAYWSVDSVTLDIATYHQPISGAHFGSQWACIDPVRRKLVVSDYNSSDLYLLDLNNPIAGFVRQVTTGGSAGRKYFGTSYHAASDAFISMDVGVNVSGEFYKLDLSTWAWSLIDKSGGVSPANQYGDVQGTNGKFNLIADMGNGQACIVLVTGTGSGHTYVYKLPMAGV